MAARSTGVPMGKAPCTQTCPQVVLNAPQPRAHIGHRSHVQPKILRQTGVIKNKHLAEQFVNNNNSLGYTPPHVNNVVVGLDTTAEQVGAAVKAPAITVTPVREGEFSAVVDDVATNYVGYMMYLPMPGPWEAEARNISNTLGMMGIREDRLPESVQIDRLRVKVTGHDGSDETLINEVTKHEGVHAEDILRLSEQIFTPWDKALKEAKDREFTFTGATAEAAKAKLYNFVGGTPAQIGEAFFRAAEKASSDFHATAKGKTDPLAPELSRVRGNTYLVTSKFRLHA